MPEINVNCLFHVDRLRFDQLEKELRQSKWIPRWYSHRLASAICSCRKHLDWQPDQEKLAEYVSYFRTLLKANEHTVPVTLVPFIKNILGTVTPSDYSRCRLLEILFLAQNGDFSLLTRLAICRNTVDGVELSKIKRKTNPFTEKQFELMMKKKKRKMNSEVIELPMYPGHVKQLDSKLDSSLVEYSKKEQFVFELKYGLNRGSFTNSVDKTYIQIWGTDPGAIQSVKTHLIQKAREVQEQALCEHEKKKAKAREKAAERQARKAARQEKKARRQVYSLNFWDDYSDQDISEFEVECTGRLAKTSGLKLKQDKHTGRRNLGRKQVKTSVDADRHCFNCLQTFSKQIDKKYCKHHPGFIVSKEWSCCDTTVSDPGDMEYEHTTSGCVKGRHNWRIHRQINRRPNRD